MPDDPYNLARFVAAQERVYASVLTELRHGKKSSHWMWYIFPQIAGLGSSATSRKYSISGLDEARAYLAHPLLGPRLRECISLVLATSGRSAREIFGFPDYLKFRSCMTLFSLSTTDRQPFEAALDKYFGGSGDPRTVRLLD